jgi:carboxymethylenebutenolidase
MRYRATSHSMRLARLTEPLTALWDTSPGVAGDVHVALPSGRAMAAVAAAPEGLGLHPGVLVIHEVFGDQPEMREVCEEFARRGYVAVMPNLYSTGGPRFICVARTMLEVASGKPGRATEAIAAAHTWLASREDVDGGRIGMIGFCMGGSFALAYIGREQSGVSVAAINYGEVPRQTDALRSACPIVASYGRRDLVTRGHAARLRNHLERLGIEHDVKLYDAAGHSFMTPGHHPVGRLIFLPMRIAYESAAAADAWQRVYSFFDDRLKQC